MDVPTDDADRPALLTRAASPSRLGRWTVLGSSVLVLLACSTVIPAADSRVLTISSPAASTPSESNPATGLDPSDTTVMLPASLESPVPAPVDPATGSTVIDTAFTTGLPDGRAATAIAAAMRQIGLPYVWGGDGPTAGDAGFDCSGLTTYAYAIAGIRLPRTAHTQYYAGPRVPAGAALQPGDLVFYGTTARVHHVGMYIGDGRMVNAPRRGKPVQVAFYRWRGDDYLGASRPAADGEIETAPLPYVPPEPVPEAPIGPPLFEAPPAPLPPILPAPTDPQPPEQETALRSIEESAPLVPIPAEPNDLPPTPIGEPVAPPAVGESASPPAGTTGRDTLTATPTGSGTPGAAAPDTSAAGPSVPPVTTTPPALTTPPTATTPPTVTTPPPTSPSEVEPVRITEAVLPGGTVRLRGVRRNADGLPRAAGIWTGGGGSIIRLAGPAAAAGADSGSPITVGYSDGTTRAYSVRRVVAATTTEAAAAVAASSAGTLVVLVPAGEDAWTVLTAV